MNNRNYSCTEGGYVVILNTIIFLSVSMFIVTAVVNMLLSGNQVTKALLESKQAFLVANSAGEEALYKLKTEKMLASSETVTLGAHSGTISIEDTFEGKTITVQGEAGEYVRNIVLKVRDDVRMQFEHAAQSGVGGFLMSEGATITGNVYSNGDVLGSGDPVISGSLTAVGLVSNLTVGESGIGDVWAYEVNNSTIEGDLYCQVASGNNKICDTSRPDPETGAFPVSSEDSDAWKAEAVLGGVSVGNRSYGSSEVVSIGPEKIEGNLTITGGAVVTVEGTVWVTGNITVDGGATLTLSTEYGHAGGVVISDGRVTLAGGGELQGNGIPGSYMLLITTSACPAGSCGGNPAMRVSGGTGAVILNAQSGTIEFEGGAEARQATADTISMSGGTSIIYDEELTSIYFASESVGSWNMVGWNEI